MNKEKILKEAKDRLKKAIDNDSENRKLALEDLKFLDGEQWPEGIKAERESKNRPCLTINKMPIYVDQVVGDQRMNRPSIKIIPVDSDGDPEVARILGGWIKHVQQISKSDIAIDHGFEHASACGYGALRVTTKYISNNSFDQEAFIEKIDNALAVYWGPHTEYDCSDAQYCFLLTKMDREEAKEKYGDDVTSFKEVDGQFIDGCDDKESLALAEYLVKEPKKKTLYLLYDGSVVETIPEGVEYKKKRDVSSYKIMWYLLSNNKVLESKEWAGKKYIPIIPIWGKELNIGGKRKVRSLIRHAKDSQRMLNYWQSSDTEVVALQPKAPFMITPSQIKGHEPMWNKAHNENYPYLLSNPDPKAPGWPSRQAPPQASSAMVAKIAMADQDIRDTIGLQKAALGMQGNERSGVAIRERKKEGDVGTFAFIDNLTRSIEHLGRVLIDVAPSILDTERIIRIGLDNGAHEHVAVNVEDVSGKILNDLSVGVYDVVVTVGPSFTTQRTEARLSMQEFIQYYPNAAPVIGDLYAQAMDWPGAEDVAKRLEFLLPPEIKRQKAEEEAKRTGKPLPEQPVQPPPVPNPIDVIKLEEEKIKLEQDKIKLEQEKAKLAEIHLKNELMMAESKENIKQLIEDILKEGEDTNDSKKE